MADAQPGIAARLVEFCEELRSEGVSAGTAELLDAVAALQEIPWTLQDDVRAALSATLAKSPEDRKIFELVFDRFFFRAAELAAVQAEIGEAGAGDPGGDGDGEGGGGGLDLDELRRQIAEALQNGSE